MIAITYTPEQAANIVAKWNELASDDYQLDAASAYLVIDGDNFHGEIEEMGYSTIEVGPRQSKTGNPATFIIEDHELTIEEMDDC